MFNSLRWRLWLTYAMVIGVALILIAITLLVFLARDNPQTNLELRNALEALGRGRDVMFFQNPDAFEELSESVGETYDVRVMIVDNQGNVLVDSQSDLEGPPPKLTDPNRGHSFGPTQAPVIKSFKDENNQTWNYASRPIQGNHWLVVARQRQTLSNLLSSPLTDDVFGALFRAGVVSLLLALLFAVLISRWVASPLQRMAAAARSVADGQRAQVALQGPNEVQALGAAFNDMAQKVHDTQQSQRDFVANVSHELKTPLTSVQGYAQAILDGTASSPETLQRSTQVIYDEAGRMHRMVVDLLDLARLDAGAEALQRTPLDLAVLLRGVLVRFGPMSKAKGVKLSSDVDVLPSFIGDGDRLAQVFINLVDNALKHTPSGGTVTVQAKPIGSNIKISILDTGHGVPPDELARIFERFYQVDKARPGGNQRDGVGLGLAIAQEIVHLHGGKLSATSELGKGSVFEVLLPVAKADDKTYTKLPVVK